MIKQESEQLKTLNKASTNKSKLWQLGKSRQWKYLQGQSDSYKIKLKK